jgi:uncharacterized protein (TIGR02246 family)
MNRDQREIRALVATWQQAGAPGNYDRVLTLVDEDVVFLGPGRPPMHGRQRFTAAARAMEKQSAVEEAA